MSDCETQLPKQKKKKKKKKKKYDGGIMEKCTEHRRGLPPSDDDGMRNLHEA